MGPDEVIHLTELIVTVDIGCQRKMVSIARVKLAHKANEDKPQPFSAAWGEIQYGQAQHEEAVNWRNSMQSALAWLFHRKLFVTPGIHDYQHFEAPR